MTSKSLYYPIPPVAKPRMTRRDVWLKPARRPVQKYRDFCTLCYLNRITFKPGDLVRFILPMPKSWSIKKRLAMADTKHTCQPDLANLIKALEDAVYPEDDSWIDEWHAVKVWGEEGAVVVEKNT